MKLIIEHLDEPLNFLAEEVNGKKSYFIEGVFAQAGVKNRNGRIYPKNIMESAVAVYEQDFISKGRAVGELDHPTSPSVNLKNASHVIESLTFSGNDVIGKAKILENTPNGAIAKSLLESGIKLGVSTRGMGNLNNQSIIEKFVLNTVDIVHDPSAPTAFVNGIMEGVEWGMDDDGVIVQRNLDKIEENINKTNDTILKNNLYKNIDAFVRSL